MMKKEAKNLENWQVNFAFLDESMTSVAPFLQGEVNGTRIKNDILLWFDPDEGIAMTQEEIFRIGEPNERWMMMFLSSGKTLEDITIKGVSH
jgi:hypothetical protein